MRIRLSQAFFAFFVIFLLLYVTSIGFKNIFRYNVFKSEYDKLKLSMKKELSINDSLVTEIHNMKKKGYWEAKIREKLPYIKPGEKVYKFY